MSARKPLTPRQAALKHGFRSGLEDKLAAQIKAAGHRVRYEEATLPYTKPAAACRYTPDFILNNGIVVESKGRFLTEDRKKHLLFKAEHPEIDLRFVFSSANSRLTKASKTTYGAWCQKHGIPFAQKNIPESWFEEPTNERSLAAITRLNLKK